MWQRGRAMSIVMLWAAAILVLAAMVVSTFQTVVMFQPRFSVSLEGGTLKFGSTLTKATGTLRGPPAGLAQWEWLPRIERWTFSTPYASGRGVTYSLPLWLPLIGAVGLAVFIGHRAAGPGAGRCEGCGYDLSGVARSSRCPECGWSPPTVQGT